MMVEFNIERILEELSINRPVFHNEADFQFALAWEIQKHHKDFEIRLEYKVPGFDKLYTDIWIKEPTPIAIELKYKTVSTILEINKESFELKPQRAQITGRYDVLKDLQRIEDIVSMYPNTIGYVILLTNDHLYWDKPRKENSVDRAFKIHDGQYIHGTLSWSNEAGVGTVKNRESNLRINGRYNTKWKHFSKIEHKSGEFRNLCFKVTS